MVQNYKVSRSVSNLDVVLDFYVDTLGSSIVHQVGFDGNVDDVEDEGKNVDMYGSHVDHQDTDGGHDDDDNNTPLFKFKSHIIRQVIH